MASVAHRGADGAGLWHDGPIGLGHRMLSTTPESRHESLPLTSQHGDFTITADARLDNRAELLTALGLGDRPPESIGDSELILQAYARWGERCPERLLGDFAFVIWDHRRQTLFCARDHFGARPFYYYLSERCFAFGSEIKALLCLTDVPRRVDELRLAELLVSALEDPVSTLYDGISRLTAGQTLSVTETEARRRTYWALEPGRELRLASDQEYAEAFRDVLTEAVRCRLRNAGPVGSTLSGGLDSSSVTCLARDLLAGQGAGPLHTYSGVYDDVPESDEREYINAVLSQGGVESHFGHPDRNSPLEHWRDAAGQEDEPFWNPQLALERAIYEAAARHGTRVVLSGLDGDTVVSHGFTYLTELVKTGHWVTFMSEARLLQEHFPSPLRKIVWQRAILPFVPSRPRQARRYLRRRLRPAKALNTPIRRDFARRIHLAERLPDLLGERAGPAHTERQEHWQGLSSALGALMFEIADRVPALFGVEPRHPFYDRRVVEFCLTLPPNQKLRGGWSRLIMRHALENVLPDTVRWRGGKASLRPAFDHGLLGADRAVLDDLILHNPGRLAEYVDIPHLRLVYRRYLDGDNADGFTIWKAATLGLWLHRTTCTA